MPALALARDVHKYVLMDVLYGPSSNPRRRPQPCRYPIARLQRQGAAEAPARENPVAQCRPIRQPCPQSAFSWRASGKCRLKAYCASRSIATTRRVLRDVAGFLMPPFFWPRSTSVGWGGGNFQKIFGESGLERHGPVTAFCRVKILFSKKIVSYCSWIACYLFNFATAIERRTIAIFAGTPRERNADFHLEE